MRKLWLVLFASLVVLPFAALPASAQVGVGIGVGPEVVDPGILWPSGLLVGLLPLLPVCLRALWLLWTWLVYGGVYRRRTVVRMGLGSAGARRLWLSRRLWLPGWIRLSWRLRIGTRLRWARIHGGVARGFTGGGYRGGGVAHGYSGGGYRGGGGVDSTWWRLPWRRRRRPRRWRTPVIAAYCGR